MAYITKLIERLPHYGINALSGAKKFSVDEALAEACKDVERLHDLLGDNLDAWDGEEESVKEEHQELMEKTRKVLDSIPT